MPYKILEVRHHAPYDGCFWEYNYFLINVEVFPTDDDIWFVEDDVVAIYSAYSNKYHKITDDSIQELYQCALDGDDSAESSTQWFYSDPRVYELDDSLWSKLPTNLIPGFSLFFNGDMNGDNFPDVNGRETGYTFVWKCDTCGLTSNFPFYMNGWRGDGGVGINADGWICYDCPDPDDTMVWCPACEEQWDRATIKRIEYWDFDGTDEEFDALLNSVQRVPDEQMVFDGFEKPLWIRSNNYIEAAIVDEDDIEHCPYCHGQLVA